MVYAYELTGYGITNEIHTQIEFKKIKENNAGITFDSAILIFENAPKNMSLDSFAITKMRTAECYRNIFRKYFY